MCVCVCVCVCVCTLILNKLHLFHHYLLVKISSISALLSGKDRYTSPFKIHSGLSLKQFIDERMSDNISLSQYISRRGRKRPNFEAGKFILLVTEKKDFMLSTVRYYPDYNCIRGTGKVKIFT